MSEWISCSDKLPKFHQNVIVKMAYQDDLMLAYISRDGSCWIECCENFTINGDAWHDTTICKVKSDNDWDKITDWQPLPALPKPPQDKE